MDRISVTLPSEMVSRLSDTVNESYDNRSEAVRDLLEKGFEYEKRITKLESEYEMRITELENEYENHITELKEQVEDLERETERLQNEKRLILEQREENTELARYVEDELSYREAGLGTRMKWWLFGKQEDDSE